MPAHADKDVRATYLLTFTQKRKELLRRHLNPRKADFDWHGGMNAGEQTAVIRHA